MSRPAGSPGAFEAERRGLNGRIAMLAFFWVLIQEAIVGKGCITVIQEAEPLVDDVAHRARRDGRHVFCVGGLCHEHDRARRRSAAPTSGRDGDDFDSTDEILAELTGEARDPCRENRRLLVGPAPVAALRKELAEFVLIRERGVATQIRAAFLARAREPNDPTSSRRRRCAGRPGKHQ